MDIDAMTFSKVAKQLVDDYKQVIKKYKGIYKASIISLILLNLIIYIVTGCSTITILSSILIEVAVTSCIILSLVGSKPEIKILRAFKKQEYAVRKAKLLQVKENGQLLIKENGSTLNIDSRKLLNTDANYLKSNVTKIIGRKIYIINIRKTEFIIIKDRRVIK